MKQILAGKNNIFIIYKQIIFTFNVNNINIFPYQKGAQPVKYASAKLSRLVASCISLSTWRETS